MTLITLIFPITRCAFDTMATITKHKKYLKDKDDESKTGKEDMQAS